MSPPLLIPMLSPPIGFNPLSLSPVILFSPAGPFYSDLGTTQVTTDGSPVRRWGDISGNGRNADAPNDSARPTLRVSGGRTWLEFDAVDDRLDVANFTAASSAIAAQHTSGTNFNTLFGSRVITNASSVRLFSATKWGNDNAQDLIGAGAWYVNNVNTQVTSNSTDETVIGNWQSSQDGGGTGWSVAWTANGSNRYWAGRIYGVLILPSSISAQNRSDLHNYFRGLMP